MDIDDYLFYFIIAFLFGLLIWALYQIGVDMKEIELYNPPRSVTY